MSTSVTTWLLPFGNETSPHGTVTSSFRASIISANDTATAFAMNCKPGCEGWTPTMTIGGWAQITPPPGLSTGVYDVVIPDIEGQNGYTLVNTWGGKNHTVIDTVPISYPDAWTDVRKWHCDIASTTVLTQCTLTEAFDSKVSGTTYAPEPFSPDSIDWSVTPMTVTITAGVEKLAATTTATAAGRSGSGAGATATATATAKSDASALRDAGGVGTLGLLAVVAAFVFR